MPRLISSLQYCSLIAPSRVFLPNHDGVRYRPAPAGRLQHSALLPIHRLPRMVCSPLVHPTCGRVCCVSHSPLSSPRHEPHVLTDCALSPGSRRRCRPPRPRSPSSSAPPESVPGVSILRPLKGLDTNMFENLESTFHQEYPNFEIIFSVANEYDQALPVVQTLLEKYPNFDARVIVGTCQTFCSSTPVVDRPVEQVRRWLE